MRFCWWPAGAPEPMWCARARNGPKSRRVSPRCPPAAIEWLNAQSIDCEGELVLRRVIGADGRSRAYVSGQIVPLQALRELADFLIEIHGQQEFQRLVNRGAQRDLLDERLSDPTVKSAVAGLFARYQTCSAELESLRAAAENRDARVDLLRYQLGELQTEVTSVADIEELFADQKRIAARSRLGAAAQTALTAAYESDSGSAHELLGRALAALRGVADIDPKLTAAGKLLDEASILAREAGDALRRYLDDLDIDPAASG